MLGVRPPKSAELRSLAIWVAMYHGQTTPQNVILTAAWMLLGLVIGLHFPDVDGERRLGRLIPSLLLLHRSILTHGVLISLLLFRLIRRRGGAAPALRPFAVGFSLAVAVHLCFDFFPKGWSGFALIHVPFYGWTNALFSQTWIMLSVVVCLYLGLLLLKNVAELVLGIGTLIISFAVSAVENGRAVLSAFILLAVATCVTAIVARRMRNRPSTD